LATSNSRFELQAYFGLLVGFAGAEMLCVVGLNFGFRGLGRARAERAPSALPIAGILLNFAAVMLLLTVAILLMTRNTNVPNF
jgi:hypothetical protein